MATSFRPEDFKPRVGLQMGLSDPVSGLNMGQTAENVARDFGITREEQDKFSLGSHLKAVAAQDKLKEEITPVYLPKVRNGQAYIDEDNGPRKGQTMEALAKLKPVFERVSGSVTAGNASQITDGAVALLMMTEKALKASGLTPLGKLVGFQYAGCDPTRMGLGPVYAINKAEQRYGLGIKDADLIEINEAFAAQVDRLPAGRAGREILPREAGPRQRAGRDSRRDFERQRWCHRAGPSGRRDRRAPGPHRAEGTASPQGQARAAFALRRRWPGWRAVGRTRLNLPLPLSLRSSSSLRVSALNFRPPLPHDD